MFTARAASSSPRPVGGLTMRRFLTWRVVLPALVLLFGLGVAGAWAVGETTGTVSACATIPAQTITVNGVPVTTVAAASKCNTVTYTVPTVTVTTTVGAVPTTPGNFGETKVLSTGDSGNGNLLVAQKAQLTQAGKLESLSFYVATASGNLRLGLYDATGPNGGPGALLAQTASTAAVTGWNTIDVQTPVDLAAATYWLTYLPSSDGLAFVKARDGTSSGVSASFTYGAMPGSFPSSSSTTASHWSMYGTVLTGGGAGTTTTAPTTTT